MSYSSLIIGLGFAAAGIIAWYFSSDKKISDFLDFTNFTNTVLSTEHKYELRKRYTKANDEMYSKPKTVISSDNVALNPEILYDHLELTKEFTAEQIDLLVEEYKLFLKYNECIVSFFQVSNKRCEVQYRIVFKETGTGFEGINLMMINDKFLKKIYY